MGLAVGFGVAVGLVEGDGDTPLGDVTVMFTEFKLPKTFSVCPIAVIWVAELSNPTVTPPGAMALKRISKIDPVPIKGLSGREPIMVVMSPLLGWGALSTVGKADV